MTLDVHSTVIRLATPADQSEWLRMRHDLWPDVEQDELLREMERIMADPMMPVFVMERPNDSWAVSSKPAPASTPTAVRPAR